MSQEGDRIVGFVSLLFLDAGKRVLEQALRVDPELRGRKIGKTFMAMVEAYLREKHPGVSLIQRARTLPF